MRGCREEEDVPTESGIAGPIPEGRDPEEYDRLRRRVLWSMPTGLFVVGSRWGDDVNLMTANLVMQVSTTPKLVAIAVETGAVTRQLVQKSEKFSISILARTDRAIVRRFVKPASEVEFGPDRAITAIQGEPVMEVSKGVPILASSVGWLACEVRQTVELGGGTGREASHILFIGEVVDVGEVTDDREPDSDASDADHAGTGRPEVLRMEDTRMNYGG